MAKKGQKPATNNTGPSKWEQGLVQAQLEEDFWKVCTALLIENKLEDAVNVNFLNSAIATGSRRLFGKVTRQNLFREVHLYGNPKNRPKEIPLYAEVCEACKVHLDNKEEIPDLLLAKLIKYKLLAIKAEDIKRRQIGSKEFEGGKNKSAKAPKSAGKKGAAKKPPEQQNSAKQGTLLKKRSEENLDQKFIDDEPDDGPQHYIIISGFYNPKLLIQLCELDIHINTVIRYRCSDYNRFVNLQPEKDDSLPKDSRLIAAEEAAAAENIRIKTGTEAFWNEIFPLLMSQPVESPLNHTHVQDQWVHEPMPLSEKNEVQAAYCAGLFDDIAHLMYDLVDSKRQYENYIRNMKIITVPKIGYIPKLSLVGLPETPLHQTGPSISEFSSEAPMHVDTRYYNDLMETIPLESVTIPVIIHCLIEQVIATDEHIEPPSEKLIPPTSDGLHQEVANHLGEMIQKLSLDEECQSSVAHMLPEEKVFQKKKLQMLNQYDAITKKFHHLVPFHDFDPEEVEMKMLKEYALHNKLLFPEVSDSEKKSLSARTQEFLYFCSKKDLPMTVVDKVLCQNVLECMSLASVNAEGTLEPVTPTSVIAWDYPYSLLEQKQLIKPVVLQNNILSEDASCSSLRESCDEFEASNYTHSSLKVSSINQKSSRSYSHFNEVQSGSRFISSTNASEFEETRNTEDEKNNRVQAAKLMNDILSCRKRNLENWNYVEHFDSNILQQVLRDALYTLPYCEKYYHHRSNCFYIMFYNPCNVEHCNKESWSIQLHSNVGFRNYMLHVAANIQDWIHEEEKKYDTLLNSLRVQKMKEQEMAIAEAALTEQLAEKAPKDGKKTPNKKAARAQSKSPTRYESIFASDGEFIRQGSLKSLKQEEELMKLEEEEKEKKKGQKTPKKLDKSAEKEPKTSPVMGQKTNRSVKSGKEDSCTELTPMTEVADEKELPFTGYDVGNNIISLTANKYTLFPSDGAQIRIETTEYLYGYQSVKCSVLKNGHVFTVHLLNPKDLEENEHLSETKAETSQSELNENVVPALFVGDEEEKFKKAPSYRERFSTIENVEKETDSLEQASEVFSEIVYSDFGSISAVLSDGIILSFSKFGPTGYHSLISENKTSLTDSPKPGTPSVPSPRDTPSGRGKKKMKRFDSSETLKVSDEIKESEPEVKVLPIEPTVPQQPTFQNLYITCPDGLKIEYFLEYSYGIEPVSPDHHRILVKQSYPFRHHGVQSCESTRNKHAYQEQHRIIVSDGTVIKKMKDGTFEVLYVDGTVAKLECVSSDKSFAEFNTASSSCVTGGKKASIPEKLPLTPIVQPDEKNLKQEKWTITYPSGQKFILTPDGKKVNLPRVLFSMKSDIKSGQTILTRDDHVILVSETTGKTIVEHEDGTRITSYYEEMTSPVQRDCGIEGMESSDEPCKKMFIMVECPSYATVKFNSKTSENLTLLANGTLINVFPDGYYSLLLAGESAGDRLYLDLDGTLTYTSPLCNNLADDTNQPETFYTFKHNAPTICETVDPDGITFKVDHKGHHEIIKESSDNNVTEKFIHVEEPPQITEYKRHAPRIFYLLPDGSGGEIHPGETIDNYLNWSKEDPACIILKDMFQDQPGIYGITLLKPYKPFPDSWLSQYELESIIPESIRLQTAINPDKIKSDSVKCPDILEIRQFTQYPLVNEEGRESIQQGLSDYIEYCFNRCSRTIESQVLDNRSEEEKKLADVLQENVKQFDLKEQLRPQLKISDVKQLYQQGITRNQTLPVIEQKQKESQNIPNIEKMQKDNLEEEMAKKALRNQEIPNYFDSMFGKAFLETQQIKTLDGKLKKLSNFPVLQTNPVKHNNIDVKTGPATHQRYMTPLSRNSYIGTYSSEIEHEYEVSHQLRPVNPSPSHATGNASPNTVRPTNPTPNLQKTEPTQERPENPTAKGSDSVSYSEIQNLSEESAKYSPTPAADSSSTPSYPGTGKNRHPDVTGKYHSQDIRLPISLVGGRPNAIPNQKFQTIEEPVRRQIRNSIMKGSTSESQWRLKMMRGMNLYPEEINFGVLREGNSYMMPVYLINTGVDSCHFKIKQPPPATGLKVIYKPGSVAAGLKRKLFLELFAIAVGADQDTGVGTIRHNLCITTETDILHLPIQATILTGFEYDRQKDENQLDPKSTSAQLISTQGKQSLIRPPKRTISKGQLRQ